MWRCSRQDTSWAPYGGWSGISNIQFWIDPRKLPEPPQIGNNRGEAELASGVPVVIGTPSSWHTLLTGNSFQDEEPTYIRDEGAGGYGAYTDDGGSIAWLERG
ncbi:hypothetical protein Tco_0945613 [Tanacetum coccineum]